MNVLTLSWKNLVHKPLDLLLNLLLFGLGVGLVSFLLLTSRQLEEKFSKNLAHIDLVIGAKGSPLQLILCNMYHLDAPTGNMPLAEAAPFLNPKHPLIEKAIPLSLGDNFKGYRIVGTTPDLVNLYGGTLAKGTLWAAEMEATIGAEVARKLSLEVGSTFQSSHGLTANDDLAHDHELKVTGVFAPTGSVLDQLILCSGETVWHVHGHETAAADEHEAHADTTSEEREITSLLVKFRGQNFQTLNMARSINENTNLQAASPAIELNKLYANIGVGESALRALAWLIIVVSGLSIFISLFNSLKNRRYEMALMRVMGATPQKLFFLIIVEGLVIAAVGYVLGIALSHGGMAILAEAMENAYRYRFSAAVFLKEEIWLLGGALAVGFLAAIIPAVLALRTEISRTLAKG